MATAQNDRRRASSASRQNGAGRRTRSSSENRKPLQGRDTGYRVGSSRRQKPNQGINPRLIVAGIVGILLIIALIFGISSCTKGCSSKKAEQKQTEEEVQTNPVDDRVAYGASSEITSKLATVLDRNEDFEKIAKKANKITDERLIDLAIAEPDAISFVLGSVKADGSTIPYDSEIPQGEFPKLYMFDDRWGYADYADGIVGSVGSGPVSLAMASMGMSGKTTYDPSSIAQAVHTAKLDTGASGMDDSFVTNHGADAGISATSVEATSDDLYMAIANGQPVLIKLKSASGIGSETSHWALIALLNADGSVSIYDPTSVTASSHTWSLGTVASGVESAYSLNPAAGTSSAATTSTEEGLEGTDETYDDGTYDESLGY